MATNTIKIDADQVFEDLQVMLWVVRVRRDPSIVLRLNVPILVRTELLAAAQIVGRVHQYMAENKSATGGGE